MPRNRSGYGRWTSGYWTVTGLRNRLRNVTLIARTTARTSWPVSRQNPGAGRSPLCATGPPQRDHESGRHQQKQRRRQQELPGDSQDLVHADAHEGPAHPGDDEEDQDRLRQEPERAEPRGPRPEPAAQEEERAEKARAQHVRVLAELDEREFHAAVLDAEPGDQLGLGLEDVERHAILGGERRHQEGDEGELADDRVGHEPQPL